VKFYLRKGDFPAMKKQSILSKYLGCLFGIAIGDALGAPVEFLSLSEIREEFGKDGITDFHQWDGFKPGSYTDDTQMSLATAIGCIKAKQLLKERGISYLLQTVYQHYLDWLHAMEDPYQVRGPGNTCLSALRSGKMGSMNHRINNSKGCGGVMRVAPVGLVFSPEEAFKIGAECTAITHGHPSGYLPAGFLSALVAYIIEGKSLQKAIELSKVQLLKHEEHQETLGKIDLALELQNSKLSVEEAILQIGQGWVGEEALGIALYCALRFSDHWTKGVLAAANHSGDSDSIASITGGILGTFLGIEAIPAQWVEKVENSEKLKNLTYDMYSIFQEGKEIPCEKYPSF